MTTDIKHLYVGEYFDKDTNLYHVRARDYSPATGRFTSMDEFEGEHKVPLTLNKYLYSNADPINKIDPSGFMTLGGLMSGISNLGTIASYAFRIYNILEKVEMSLALTSVWAIAKELRNNIHGIEQLLKDPSLGSGPLLKVDRMFLNHISNFDRGVNTLLRNSGALLIRTLMKAKILRALPAAKALLIGGPTPDSGGKLYDLWRHSPAIKRVLTLGRVSFKKKRLPIVFP